MKPWLKVLLGVGSVALTGGTIAYLATGRREEDSPFIPNSIEGRIDRLVTWLDQHFSKRWVDHGLDALQRRLEGAHPALAGVLHAVFYAEREGRQRGWGGAQKRAFAVQRLAYV
jgi:hypothetical protein